MSLKFQVQNGMLIEKKSHNHEDLFCSFVFCTREWKRLEKFVIFWNKEGKSFIRYLGKGSREQCPIPNPLLDDLYFYIQVYANDDVFTNKLKVFCYEHQKEETHQHRPSKKALNKFFKDMEGKIDNIVYEDNKLLVYANNKLVKTIDIVDEALLSKVLTGTAPDYIVDETLSPTSTHPLANKAIYEALSQKMDLDSLATVAYTGDFNDLVNVPDFAPESHTHLAEDVVDLEDNVNLSIDELLDTLSEEFEN